MMALLCHSVCDGRRRCTNCVTMMDVTMTALLCQRCHHDGCHHDGTAVPTLSPRWVPPPWRCCTNSVTMMDITVMAPLCLQCHHDGWHHCGTAGPTLSP